MATSIISSQQLRELSKQVRGAKQGDIGKTLRKAIRDAARPAMEDVRASVLTLNITGDQGSTGVLAPTRGGGRKVRGAKAAERARTDVGKALAHRRAGLRQTVAAAVRVRALSRGVTIEVNYDRMPNNQRGLPNALNLKKGWRHPVFGNRDVWVFERGGPWFYEPLYKHVTHFNTAVRNAMTEASDKLAQRIG